MRRILYLTRGSDISGSQRQLLYLVSGIDRTKFEPIVVCSEEGMLVDKLHEKGIQNKVLRLRPWRKVRNTLSKYYDADRLSKFANQQDVDLIHCSYQWHYQYACFLAKKQSIPLILHLRHPITTWEFVKYRYNRADSVIAISNRIKKQLLASGADAEKVACIDDAVDTTNFNYRQERLFRREHGIGDGVLFGIVGRVSSGKRQLDFVKAAKEVLKKECNAYFAIIGGLGCKDYYLKVKKYIEKHSLSSRVILVGRREDMPDILSSIDVLVSLSGGSVMFEAMACGRTVISAGFTKAEDAVHVRDSKTGILISTREKTPLVEAMVKVVEDDLLRQRLGNNAMDWAREHLSQSGLVAKTEQLYDRMIPLPTESLSAM